MTSETETSKPSVIWLASYPRSGNSWVRILLGSYACGEAADWEVTNQACLDIHKLPDRPKPGHWDPRTLSDSVKNCLEEMPTTQFRSRHTCIKTHFPWSDNHPWHSRTHKALYIIRNPRDVLVSSIDFLKLMKRDIGSTPQAAWDFIRHGGAPRWLKIFGPWYDHYRSWTTECPYPVHLVRYEALKQNTFEEFRRILQFLEIPVDADRVQKAIADSAIENVRRLETVLRQKNDLPQFHKDHRLVREGKSNQSLDTIESGLDETFNKAFAAHLEATGYR